MSASGIRVKLNYTHNWLLSNLMKALLLSSGIVIPYLYTVSVL